MSAPEMKRCAGTCGRPMVAQGAQRHLGEVVHGGRGLCAGCYRRAYRAGVHIDCPRSMRSADEVLDEWDRLRRAGVLRVDAARRIGVRIETLERMLQRHRDDPRAKLGQRQELHFRVRDETTGRWAA